MPVIFPGFSRSNLQRATGHPGAFLDQIPRHGGDFLWTQAVGYWNAGATMLYGAMFDEVDEGTAMFKLRTEAAILPATPPMVDLEQENAPVPPDRLLRIAGRIS